MAALQRYSWPGNIRELRNVVERAMIVATGPRLTMPLPGGVGRLGQRSETLEDVEREHIRSVARERRLAHPRRGRRRRTARAQAHHARDAHGQARDQAAGTMTPRRCRRNSATAISINGISVRK